MFKLFQYKCEPDTDEMDNPKHSSRENGLISIVIPFDLEPSGVYKINWGIIVVVIKYQEEKRHTK